MCGRYTNTAGKRDVIETFSEVASLSDEGFGRFNVCPTEQVAALVRPGDAPCEAAMLRWGLVPWFAKDERIGARMINARAETITEKSAYRELVAEASSRCLVIADGWYEWLKAERPKQPRQPIHFRLPGREPLAFAGLWTTWRPRDGRVPLRTCTIITTAANRDSMRVHDRMPVVLPDDAARAAWLDPALDGEAVMPLLAPLPDGLLELVPANPVVNKAGYEGADCLEAPAALF
jgi:putative SOS response-associated peptidase YedK